MTDRRPHFLTHAYLLDKYGPRLSVVQLAECLGLAPGTVRNRLSRGGFGVPTYLDGGNRWADARDVALYLDDLRQSATTQEPGACTDAGSASLHAL